MSLKLCRRGHLTGFRKCGQCGAETAEVIGESLGQPVAQRMDKRVKRGITNAIRAAGGEAVADLRRKYRAGAGGGFIRPRETKFASLKANA